jgi:hypothetical protein
MGWKMSIGILNVEEIEGNEVKNCEDVSFKVGCVLVAIHQVVANVVVHERQNLRLYKFQQVGAAKRSCGLRRLLPQFVNSKLSYAS